MSEEVLYELRDSTAWVTINRPEARNALSAAVRAGLLESFERFNEDADAAVLVLTGAGDKAFSAGGDLKEMAHVELTVVPSDYVPQPNRTIKIDKPVIAAVNGIAYGGGFLLAQSADLVVASETAKFGITEARVGRGSPWAAPLPWLVPPRIAMEILITAEPIAAQRAYEVGLINAVVPAADLHDHVAALAAKIAANAPLSVRAGKAMVYAVAEHARSAAFEEAERLWEPVYLSADALEGPRAFAEKRSPVWQGR